MTTIDRRTTHKNRTLYEEHVRRVPIEITRCVNADTRTIKKSIKKKQLAPQRILGSASKDDHIKLCFISFLVVITRVRVDTNNSYSVLRNIDDRNNI